MSLVKSLVIPAALALSLVATESRAELQKFERVTNHNSNFAAFLVCNEFKSRRGINYQTIKERVSIWMLSLSRNYPSATIQEQSRTANVQQSAAKTWRCNMAWTIRYTLGSQ